MDGRIEDTVNTYVRKYQQNVKVNTKEAYYLEHIKKEMAQKIGLKILEEKNFRITDYKGEFDEIRMDLLVINPIFFRQMITDMKKRIREYCEENQEQGIVNIIDKMQKELDGFRRNLEE